MFFFKRKTACPAPTPILIDLLPDGWPPEFHSAPFSLIGAPVLVEVERGRDPTQFARISLEDAAKREDVKYRAEGFEMEVVRV
ncbi:hypothetical protein EUX98_g1399 [Antrodiella citrinella]|uniref:Uncharacterized protein n=1 Tax=Antrodiella citrinella TaxID=2447956 RepID=A0A4S4NA27_9APHY|nr:hypothetical protein EUX98_g1399 [Antrodiella citrinella]